MMHEELNERQTVILEQGINDYIKTGEPVTSGGLYARHRLGIKPAMIRRELNALDANGYLTQLHASGGRVPTRKGYQFLIEKLKQGTYDGGKPSAAAEDVRSLMEAGSFEEAAHFLSRQLHLFSLVYNAAERLFYDSGLEELCASDAFADKEDVLDVIRDVELLPRRIAAWERLDGNEWPLVFVGRNALVESDALSVVADRANVRDGCYGIMVVGPTRMNYRSTLGFLKSIDFVHR